MAKPETRFWHYWKKNTPNISWTRIENATSFGTPDLLGYNKNQFFFTVELKVAKRYSVTFSPHQISFHVRHPKNSFILVGLPSTHGPWCLKLYEGSRILELEASGLKLEPCASELEACRLKLESLALGA